MLDMDQHTGMQVSWWEWNRWRFRVVSSASGGEAGERDETKKEQTAALLTPAPAHTGSRWLSTWYVPGLRGLRTGAAGSTAGVGDGPLYCWTAG